MPDTPAGFVVSPRLTRRLTMAEAAQVLGWTNEGHRDAARTTLHRLKRYSARLGEPIVHCGLGRGNKSWTTYAALRKAGLLDDEGRVADTVAAAMQDTLARLDAAERTARVLARTCTDLANRVAALEVLLEAPRKRRRSRTAAAKRKRRSERNRPALPAPPLESPAAA